MNTNASINVGVKGTEQIDKLTSKLKQATSGFESLRGALVGFASAAYIGSLFKMANEITDMAEASGIATQSILGFGKAVSGAGGNVDGANAGIGKFVLAIENAVNGGKEAQDTFLALGVSLQDLRNLSEEDLLKKAVAGFNNATTASERMSLAVALFGKTARSWNMDKINQSLDEYISKSKQSAAAVEAAGQASENFSMAFKDLGIQILATLKPISELATAIMGSANFMRDFIRISVELAAVVLTFTALGKVWKWAGLLLAEVRTAAASIGGAVAGATASLSGFGAVLMAIVKRAPLIGAIAVALGFLFGHVKTGLEEMGVVQKKDTKDKNDNADAANRQAGAGRDVVDAYKKQKDAIKELVDQFDKQNQKSSTQLQLETSLLGLSKEEADAKKAQYEIAQRYQDTLDKLTESRQNLTQAELRAGMGSSIDAQISRIGKLKDAAMAKTKVDVKANAISVANDEFTKFAQKNEIDNLKTLQSIQDDIAKSTLSEIERKYYDIEAAAKATAKAQIDAETLRRGAPLSEQEQKRYYDQAAKGNAQLQKAANDQYVNSRRFSTGWKNAFDEYVSNANNAATKAQSVFQSLSQNLEDALFKFFTTGKMGWKDFANNVIQEMIRIETRQLAANILTGGTGRAGGAGSGLLGLGNLFGFLASGGPASANKPYIVGERGPELFVPNTSGTVVPNNALGGGAVTYNINAVDAMSFKQMLAQDPTFLHAVAEQGRRRLPGAR